MSWKGVLGSLLVGGSQGYLAGKQQEWADEAQQLKSQAAARLKQGERQWAVEDREAGFAHDVEMERLKQTSQREHDETQHGRALELAHVKAGSRGTGGSDDANDGWTVKELKEWQPILSLAKEEAYEKADAQIPKAGFFGDKDEREEKVRKLSEQFYNADERVVRYNSKVNVSVPGITNGDVVQPPQPIMIDADSPGAAISGMLGKPERRTDAVTTEDITHRTQQIRGTTRPGPKQVTPSSEQIRGTTRPSPKQVTPDSKETNIILPALKKLANTEFNLADALGAIGSAIGKLAGGTAEATVPDAESVVRESAKAVAARIEQRVGELSQDEAVQLKRYVDSMLKNKAITQEAANQIIAMINRGDTASVSELLRSL